jgi:NADPH-dependent glutamate synthase beta subunit-like oxidoreductase/NAD(P)H-flavin reductase
MENLSTYQAVHRAFEVFLEPDSLGKAYVQALAQKHASSDLLLALAIRLEAFLARHFNIEPEVAALHSAHDALEPLVRVKRQFVQRYALKKYPTPNPEAPAFHFVDEASFAGSVLAWQEEAPLHETALMRAAQYAAWASLTPAGQARHKGGILFNHPAKTDPGNLLKHTYRCGDDRIALEASHLRPRDGFSLTDGGLSHPQSYDQANYCIVCHPQGKDTCRTGMPPRGGEEGPYHTNPLGNVLEGCPLDQKISEMNALKSQGYVIAALAVIMIDNPLVAATGHRICNACMKACIFQKQEAVNIPGVETEVLKAVLALPYGFEVYNLLAWWNPLNVEQPLPLEPTGRSVLVAGMGPSGFTLAYYLLRQGHRVIGVDGLKIEPMAIERGPIKQWADYVECLDSRVINGFGGVAEYGITVRWDKNFLMVIRLILERCGRLSLLGGVRLGGTLTLAGAFERGMDHIALCLGAGNPHVPLIEGNLAVGVRQAYDFLMALQLTGANKPGAATNVHLRLPAVVVGGGLTAIDTATEVMAYYVRMVEQWAVEHGDSPLPMREPHRTIAAEFQAHSHAIAAERALATRENRQPNFIPLLQSWGGVTVLYRGDLTKAPSYRLNHEEIQKALEEGIFIQTHSAPVRIELDAFGHGQAIVLRHKGATQTLPARSIFMAAGTKPNRNIMRDEPTPLHFKEAPPHEVMVDSPYGRGRISYFGDMHKAYSGSVVKAMASAKNGYPHIDAFLRSCPPSELAPEAMNALWKKDFSPYVVDVIPHGDGLREVIIHAPAAAKNFKPGHFFRLQTFEKLGHKPMKPVALRPIAVDQTTNSIHFLIAAVGKATGQLRALTPGEPVALMGPTGEALALPAYGPVLIIGQGTGPLQLLPFANAFKTRGLPVTFLAVDATPQGMPHEDWLAEKSDRIIYTPGQNLETALHGYGPFAYVLCSGSPDFLERIQTLRQGAWRDALTPGHQAIAAINTTLQCMLKAICAQCLQRLKDPQTGEERIIFTCAQPNQKLEAIDLTCLRGRLAQNDMGNARL